MEKYFPEILVPDELDVVTYRAAAPSVEVVGHFLLDFVDQADSNYKEIRDAFKRSGIRVIRPTAWYYEQQVLDALREVAYVCGDDVLRRMGKRLSQTITFLPVLRMEDVLQMPDEIYRNSHRNDSAACRYQVKSIDKRSALIECRHPYPCAFDQGLIQGLVTRFAGASGPRVQHGDRCRKKGHTSCDILVVW